MFGPLRWLANGLFMFWGAAVKNIYFSLPDKTKRHFCNALQLDPLATSAHTSPACQQLRRLASVVWGKGMQQGALKTAGGEGIGQGPGRKAGALLFLQARETPMLDGKASALFENRSNGA